MSFALPCLDLVEKDGSQMLPRCPSDSASVLMGCYASS